MTWGLSRCGKGKKRGRLPGEAGGPCEGGRGREGEMRSTGRFMTPGEGFEPGEARMNRSKFLEGEERWNDKATRVPKRKIGFLDAKML